MQPVVKVRNLPRTMNRLSLASLFNQFGTVVSVKVDVDVITGRSQGTGEVRFETLDGVNQALATKELEYHGVKIEITS